MLSIGQMHPTSCFLARNNKCVHEGDQEHYISCKAYSATYSSNLQL